MSIASPGGALQMAVEEERIPGPEQVRVAVKACGVCRSDAEFVTGRWPGIAYPVTPGHEIAGVIEAVGDAVESWQVGDRVAIGWSGGYCEHCPRCRRGDFMFCQQNWVTGASFPGGFAYRPGANPGRAVVRRRRATGMRGRDDFQLVATGGRGTW